MRLWLTERRSVLNSPGYMTLRTIVLALAVLGLGVMLAVAVTTGQGWPFVIFLLVISLAIAFERRHYGRAIQSPPGSEWVETGEQFVDDASGALVRVWFNPTSGERKYVEVGANGPGQPSP